MKKFFICIFLMLPGLCFARGMKITSFYYSQKPITELCGQVFDDSPSPIFIKVKIDPGQRSAVYNSYVGDDRRFCVTVTTYAGVAEVYFMNDTKKIEAFIK
ncbi:MAG: hypothetical protein AB7I27_15785 [Bacteriovoracaceae bacterium]